MNQLAYYRIFPICKIKNIHKINEWLDDFLNVFNR